MSMWQDRLNAIIGGATLPRVAERLALGRLKRWGAGFIEKEWEVDPSFCTGEGTSQQALFGGYVAALADQALAFTAMTVMDEAHYFRTVDLHVTYYDTIPSGKIEIRGRVMNRSRRLLHVEAEFIREDGTLAAKASAIQVVIPYAAANPETGSET